MKINNLRIVLEYLLVFCIILEFYTPYTVFPFTKRIVQLLPILVLCVLIIISHYSIKNKINCYIIIFLAGAVFPLFPLSNQAYSGYILRYVLILPLLWIYLYSKKRNGLSEYLSVFIKYSNVIMIIAVISLVIWLLGSVLQIIHSTALVPYEWGGRVNHVSTYWGIYFETQSSSLLGMQIWRNSGIFNEAPMYNMVLCTAFAIEYFIRPIKSKIRLWILVITILTTQTTTGQLFLIAIGAWLIYSQIAYRRRALLLIMVPILLYGSYWATDRLMDNKVKTGGDVSVNDRTEDILICLEVGMEHPLLGIGLVAANGEQVLWEGKEFGFSNSLFAVFARGGLYGLSLYIIALLLIPYCFYRKYKDSRWLLTMLCFFFVFSITNSSAKYLTFLFLAWGLSNIDLKKWNT